METVHHDPTREEVMFGFFRKKVKTIIEDDSLVLSIIQAEDGRILTKLYDKTNSELSITVSAESLFNAGNIVNDFMLNGHSMKSNHKGNMTLN